MLDIVGTDKTSQKQPSGFNAAMGATVPTNLAERASNVYELVESHPLPAIDLSRSLGSACCSAAAGKCRERTSPASSAIAPFQTEAAPAKRSIGGSRTARLLCDLGYAAGLVVCALTPCVPVEHGRPMAVVSTVLMLPNMLVKLMLIRYNVLRLLFLSYEFWYFVVISTVTCVLLAAYVSDIRAMVVLIQWMGHLNGAAVDANTTKVWHSAVASAFGSIINLQVMCYVQFELIEAANDFAVFRYGGRVLSAKDVVVNGLATSAIMLLRNAIRRFVDLKQQKRIQCTLLRCVNYRCTVKLQLRENTVQNERRIAVTTEEHQHSRYPSNQLVLVKVDSFYDASQTFYPLELNGLPWSKARRFALALLGHAGVAFSVVGFLDPWSIEQRRSIFAVGLACTLCFCLTLSAMKHTQLFRDVITSFDFLFLSFQLTSAHLCACDMFYWDARCLGLLSSWLWMHFVLTTDALTPLVKQKIAFCHGYLVLPVSLFIAGQIWIIYALLMDAKGELQDRKMHEIVVGGRTFAFGVVPFFFSRVATSFLWCLRILWRITVAQADDVVLLRGKVAYVYLSEPTPSFPMPPSRANKAKTKIAPRTRFSRTKE